MRQARPLLIKKSYLIPCLAVVLAGLTDKIVWADEAPPPGTKSPAAIEPAGSGVRVVLQVPPEGIESLQETGVTAIDGTDSTRNEWVIAPIPFINPVLGFGLAGGAAYIYRPPGADKESTPWTSGVGGFYSENKSWAFGMSHKMNLKQDAWRLDGKAGYGQVYYDFYGIGDANNANARYVSLSQSGAGGAIEVLYRLKEHLYAGLDYSLAQINTRVTGSDLPPWFNDIITRPQINSVLSIPSLRLQWDSRDSTFYPTQGWLMDGTAAFSDESFGSSFTFQTLALTMKHYQSLSARQTLAFYVYGRFAFGDVPFFELSKIGAKNNLRGYPEGRYQDRMVLTGQLEYRWQVWRRIGLVAFGGVGAVAPDLNGFGSATKLPSVGGGLRYLLAEKNKINFRLDMAWGRDERLLYLGVGEAF